MAENQDEIEQGALPLDRPGERLRRAREAAGLDLQEVATRTRVPIRLLQALEASDYAALPGPTYCIGFSRAYARAVGLDEVEMAAQVRAELEETNVLNPHKYEAFEPADPARVPPRFLAWTAGILAILIAVGYGIWRTQFFTPPTEVEIAAQKAPPSAPKAPAGVSASAPVPPPPAPVEGPVVLTATDIVWLRIYDQAGDRLFEKQMAKGESYTVPASANNPMILTGRADALAVTVGGKPVPPLGSANKTVSDLPISAAALLARPAGSAVPGATPAPVGSAPAAPASRQQPVVQPAPADRKPVAARPAAPAIGAAPAGQP